MNRFTPTHPSTAAGQPPATASSLRPRRRFYTAIAVVLLLALCARLPYLPRLGNGYDLEEYRQWTAAIQDHGLADVYAHSDADYVGYQYLLWLIGKGYGHRVAEENVRDKALRLWLKSPGIAGDLLSTMAVAGLAYWALVRRTARLSNRPARRLAAIVHLNEREALAAGAGFLWALNPALIYAGAYWGQNDSLVTAFAVAAVWAALGRNPALAAALLAAGAVIKPQPLIVAPVLAWLVLARSGWGGVWRAALAGGAVLVAGHAYFVVVGHGSDIVDIYRTAVLTPQRLTFNAFNLWWLMRRSRDAASSEVALDVGPLSPTWGQLAAMLVLTVLAITIVALIRRRDDGSSMLAAVYLVFGFFVVGSGVHERYDLPALALLAPALPLAPRWTPVYLTLSVTITLNAAMGIPLDRLYPTNQPFWLAIGVAAINVALLVWCSVLVLRGTGPRPVGARVFD